MKPSLIRDITIGDHKFTTLHIYESGGKSKISLYENYKSLAAEEDQLGQLFFLVSNQIVDKKWTSKSKLIDVLQ